ncbi:TetR/AcrR family transcriptional regulator [Pseudonocardia humida]|uniref:TetR family transcriptional regulator n=1 Tax=Pseudonocardia humida TaxID=2800819 RepID=A0ABT0ZZM8_9PSEU|nr:TetR family transcriptional regulator [Pseudonocardia humida]MCO1656218.1 TetR family transcriptional regulator [Pseudonocardia humida]
MTSGGGLRERKKARTRAAIQQHALRLFRERGYAATTVEQVAEAAEVSPSTVFRYFAGKDDLAVLDDHHSLAAVIPRLVAEQPAELGPLAALRAALRTAFAGLDPHDRAARTARDLALLQVPELWAANAAMVGRALDALGELVARRTGRDPADPAVRALIGAVAGVSVRALLDAANTPGTDPVEAVDRALGLLESGLAL